MERYHIIDTKFPREFLLLQGQGCRWRKCTFCDYHNDISDNLFAINKSVLDRVQGIYGVLDIINSGSATELDSDTIAYIKQIVRQKHIHTLWFESHYMYRHQLREFALQFAPATVKFRCGVETFDTQLRNQWKKGIPDEIGPAELCHHFQGVCLLCCTLGENKQRIVNDIAIARSHFEYCSVNLFCNNTTPVRRDDELVKWFIDEIYPTLQHASDVEVLVNNTDLGVG